MRMSDTFVINVKVIVGIAGTLLLLIISVLLNNYVENEKQFKKDVTNSLTKILEQQLRLENKNEMQDIKIIGLGDRVDVNEKSIRNIKYTLRFNEMPIIKDSEE